MTAHPRRTSLLPPLVVAAIALAACSDGGDDSSAGAAAATETTSDTEATPADAGQDASPDELDPTTTAESGSRAGDEPAASDEAADDASDDVAPGDESPAPACADVPVGVSELVVTGGDVEHPVRIFVPEGLADATTAPTVLNWHGLGSNGFQQAVFTGYEELAATERFVVVHPTGVPAPGDSRNSWELLDEQDPTRDDVAFAGELIDLLVSEWCADPQRVYSTGMSNGGYFTARLVCEIGDRLAAAVSVAGTYHLPTCDPPRAVPYRAYHGTADDVVPFDGSGESTLLTDDIDPALRLFFEQVMPEEFAEFATDAGCDVEPTTQQIGDDVIRYDYASCDDGAELAFFEILDGGHTWPSSPIADQIGDVLGSTTTTVDATADAWAFFERFTLPADT